MDSGGCHEFARVYFDFLLFCQECRILKDGQFLMLIPQDLVATSLSHTFFCLIRCQLKSQAHDNCHKFASSRSTFFKAMTSTSESSPASSDSEDKPASVPIPTLTSRSISTLKTKQDPLLHVCWLCNTTDDLTLCPDCEVVYYCSEAHGEIHRPATTCFPLIVQDTPELGRYASKV